MHRGIGWENLRERSNMEYLRVGRRMNFKEIGWQREDCVDMAEDRDK
jgi:hypothetical protein